MSATKSHSPDSETILTPGEPRRGDRPRFWWLRYAFAWPVALQPLLWGVDDEVTRREIEQAVYRNRSDIRWFVAFVIGAAIVGAIAKRLVARISPAIPEWVVFAIVLFSFQSGIAWRLRRGILRDLRRVLASMGRCEGCGYDRKGSVEGACPECGAAG